MPRYSFRCESKRHPDSMPREFEQTFTFKNAAKVVDQCKCGCGAIAKRDLAKDLPSVATSGMTPIQVSDSKFSVANEIKFAAGQFKQNPDGTTDKNHAPFRDTGELQRWMNGANDMGDPVLKDDGKPLRRKDGTIVRQGAKLFKYGKSAQPSRQDVPKRRPRVPGVWIDEKKAGGTRGGLKSL